VTEADVRNVVAMLRSGDRSQGELNAALAQLLELALAQDQIVAGRLQDLEQRVAALERPGVKIRLRGPAELPPLIAPEELEPLPDRSQGSRRLAKRA
jgi:hypothetical protein